MKIYVGYIPDNKMLTQKIYESVFELDIPDAYIAPWQKCSLVDIMQVYCPLL